MNERVIIVHWTGPFSFDELDSRGEAKVLYLATGRTPFQRNDQIQYCGITERTIAIRMRRHPKLALITKNPRIWVGRLAHPHRSSRADLEATESMVVYLWGPPLNERKKMHPPRRCIVVSHWFYPDGRPRQRKRKILRDLYDVMCWDGEFWRTSNLRRWADSE